MWTWDAWGAGATARRDLEVVGLKEGGKEGRREGG